MLKSSVGMHLGAMYAIHDVPFLLVARRIFGVCGPIVPQVTIACASRQPPPVRLKRANGYGQSHLAYQFASH